MGESLVSVKEFLRTKAAEPGVFVRHYKADARAVVYGKGDMLITLAKFKHR
jgi:hypothetical protein